MYKNYRGTLLPGDDRQQLEGHLRLINERRERIVSFQTFVVGASARYVILTEVLDPEKQTFDKKVVPAPMPEWPELYAKDDAR